MEKNQTLIKVCKNCGTIYNLKTEMPIICWACGMPTDEQAGEYGEW